jgi:hypothetical protein
MSDDPVVTPSQLESAWHKFNHGPHPDVDGGPLRTFQLLLARYLTQPTNHLEAEVERLRGENADLNIALSQQAENYVAAVSKLEAKNAAITELLQVMEASETATGYLKLKAKLAWFEGIWPYVERLIADAEGEPLPAPSLSSLYDIHRYQDEYPKP